MATENLQDFAISCSVLTRSSLVAPGNPITVNFLGHDSGGVSISRDFILSYEQPDIPLGATPVVWFNADTWDFYKSTNWRDPIPIWELVPDWQTLFDESAGGSSFTGGHLTSPLHLARNPVDPMEPVTKAYFDSVITNITVGTGSAQYGEPVADIAALQAVDVTLVVDKQIRYVESVNRIFAYDLQSVATIDGDYIVKPNVGPGRWISTDRKLVDGGVI